MRDIDHDEQQEPLTFWQVVGSILAGAIGVQTNPNRKRDFTRGKAIHFIIVGIVFTILFMLTVISVVNLAVSSPV